MPYQHFFLIKLDFDLFWFYKFDLAMTSFDLSDTVSSQKPHFDLKSVCFPHKLGFMRLQTLRIMSHSPSR